MKGENFNMRMLNELSKALQAGDVNTVKEWIHQVLNERFIPREILYDELKNGMSVIGEKF